MSGNVTLKDVARVAGVSYQTVSKVLRNQIQVTAETRTRIEAAVEQLGYRPNTAARSLRTHSTFLIGYSWRPPIHDDPNHILEGFLRSIVRTAEQHHYHIMLFPYASSSENLLEIYRELITSNRVDGFILSDIEYEDPRIPLLQELDFPFVAFGRSSSTPDFPYVDVDGRAGVRMAVEHFIEQGHSKIALLAWPTSSRVGEERLQGYYDAMQQSGLTINPAWVRRDEGTLEAAYRNTLALLDLGPGERPTAVVTLVDIMGLGAIRAAQDRGYTIGRDFAVCGFDDTPLAHHIRPSLTSLRQPVEQVGEMTVEMLMKMLSGDQPAKDQWQIPPELIVRKSSLRGE